MYRAYIAMLVPTAVNNSSPFFGPPKDDKNLIIEAQVVKVLFVLEILDSIKASSHQRC